MLELVDAKPQPPSEVILLLMVEIILQFLKDPKP